VLAGFLVAVVGYALIYNALSALNPSSASFPFGTVGVADGLIPGRVQLAAPATPAVPKPTTKAPASTKKLSKAAA
jgi:hypothetical protein